ncbi:MAG: hypothetical protein IJX77_03510 [Ruminococcus sp.]|nr:hypothetical protein [Ruminococcus sp.]
MKKFMSLICSAAMASAMLANIPVSAEENALPEYHTYNELMEMGNDELAALYAESFPEYFTENGEYKMSDESEIALIEETISESEELLMMFQQLQEEQSDGVLKYRVNPEFDLDFDLSPSALGLPDEWEIKHDAGHIDGWRYYIENSYYISVPYETATDFDCYIRLCIAQRLWSMHGMNESLNIEYGTPLFMTLWIAGSPQLLGDVDRDGIDIADAAAVMSYVTNPEKYPLDIYQQRAADVYQNGDGLNQMDVLTIQKKLAGITQTLPETYLDFEVTYDLSDYNYEQYTLEELLAMSDEQFLELDAYRGASPEALTKEQEYRCFGEVLMQRGGKITYTGELPEDFRDVEGVSTSSIGLVPLGEDTYYSMMRLVPTFYLDKSDVYANELYTTTMDVENALAELIGDDISYTVKMTDIEEYWIQVDFDIPVSAELTEEDLMYYVRLYYIMTSINPGFECY